MKPSNIQFGADNRSNYYVSMDLQCFKEFNIFVLNKIIGNLEEKYFKIMNDNLDFLKKTLLSNR